MYGQQNRLKLIPENVSLDIKDFKIFIKEREVLLKKRLLEVVGYVDDNVEENENINEGEDGKFNRISA